MSFNNNNTNSVYTDPSQRIKFIKTEDIEKLGIKEFVLQGKDFLITWSNGRNTCIDFKYSSIAENIKTITKVLKKQVIDIVDDKTYDNALGDIEDQLIKKREEIYSLNTTKTSENNSNNEYKSKTIENITHLKKQFESSLDPLNEWQSEVNKKYNILYKKTIKYYPNAWPLMQFILSVKTILNIDNNKLPFLGIILALPSSLKTTFINFFRKYNNTFYSDSFTPNSLISHNSALTEVQLKEVDMLPKMKNKLVLTPELAPLFTAKDDDLQKILGIIIRLLDGDGLESDSGAHGHRGYPPTIFSWVGAIVEIPPKVWKILSTLGFKIYFFRPEFLEKSVDDLVNIAFDNKISEKNQDIENALSAYLQVFDSAPKTDVTSLDENGIVKIKWNDETTTNFEQYRAIQYIAKIAKLLASLRGDVYVYQHKSRQSTKLDVNDVHNESQQQQQVSYQIDQVDYETDSVIIEDPSRATIQLRNLALGNAISKGRNYIKIEDVKLVIKVALSTTRVTRKKVFDLLLKENGNVTTSTIVKELDISEPTARKTMREFQALEIANVSSTSSYASSELTLVLNGKFRWFLSEEFQNLRYDKTTTVTTIHNQSNTEYRRMVLPLITKTLSNSYYYTIQKACDNKPCDSCHTLKAKLPPETEIKKDKVDGETNNKFPSDSDNNIKPLNGTDKEITSFYISNNTSNYFVDNTNKIENCKKNEGTTNIKNNNNSKDTRLDQISIKENNLTDSVDLNLQKNSVSLGPENFQHVTVSHANCHTNTTNMPQNVVKEILDIIKSENGTISLGYTLQLACQRSQIVRDYLRKEKKLTQRDSRTVQNLFVEIVRHRNIKIIKRKPELIVKWIENEEKQEMTFNN